MNKLNEEQAGTELLKCMDDALTVCFKKAYALGKRHGWLWGFLWGFVFAVFSVGAILFYNGMR